MRSQPCSSSGFRTSISLSPLSHCGSRADRQSQHVSNALASVDSARAWLASQARAWTRSTAPCPSPRMRVHAQARSCARIHGKGRSATRLHLKVKLIFQAENHVSRHDRDWLVDLEHAQLALLPVFPVSRGDEGSRGHRDTATGHWCRRDTAEANGTPPHMHKGCAEWEGPVFVARGVLAVVHLFVNRHVIHATPDSAACSRGQRAARVACHALRFTRQQANSR